MYEVYSSSLVPRVEVFSVVVQKHRLGPLNLYGSIRVRDDCQTQTIYEREREDSELLRADSKGFPLSLDGPSEFCTGNFAFDIDLKHKVQGSDDEEVCKGAVEGGSLLEMKLNELFNLKLDGKDCSVEFGLGLYDMAVRGHVKATLINLKMKDIKVFGKIASRTSLLVNASKHLFNKKKKDGIMVHEHHDGVVLQLPCPVVAAPLDSELTVLADLSFCRDGDACSSLVRGTATFLVKGFGMSVGIISGIDCDIQVEVHWLYID